MLENKTKEWIPSESTLLNWFNHHPEISTVPERRHIGQLVLTTQKEAEDMRLRILNGESLFTLAGKYSIDPQGRSQNGDMGWVEAGRGMPELDQALTRLGDNKVSEVIKTSAGYHLLTILEHEPGEKKSYVEVRDRIRQIIINEKQRPYLGQLERRYKVTWNVIQGREDKAEAPAHDLP
jgi:parvulin-like peptidyl-prolyl isomerase